MKLKRVLALVLALVMLVACGAVGCSQQNGDKIIIGLDDSFPPLGFRDKDNNLVGFDVDVAKETFKRLGIEVEFLPIDWTIKETELNSEKVDVLWNGYTITEARKKEVEFSDPYMNNAQVVVVTRDSGYTKLSDLAGKSLAIQSGSSAEEALDAATDFKASLAKVNGFKENLTAFLDLESGSSEAVLLDEVVANYYISTYQKDFVILDEKLAKEEYGVGFRKGDELRDKVNEELKKMAGDGTLAKISEEWFGSDVTTIGK